MRPGPPCVRTCNRCPRDGAAPTSGNFFLVPSDTAAAMFERIGEDYAFYRSWRHRALWALLLYRFGQWSLSLRFAPARWATGKAYGLVRIVAPVFTGVAIDRGMRAGR